MVRDNGTCDPGYITLKSITLRSAKGKWPVRSLSDFGKSNTLLEADLRQDNLLSPVHGTYQNSDRLCGGLAIVLLQPEESVV